MSALKSTLVFTWFELNLRATLSDPQGAMSKRIIEWEQVARQKVVQLGSLLHQKGWPGIEQGTGDVPVAYAPRTNGDGRT